ncbi:hypothetical protein, partial [Lacticaseibacillus kribbianus]|uniref:hypothetical protein n=1 Tax=Lacticaseibacillus kribbianus TaxID=2926292 RepID=UPI001CD3325A
MTGKSDAYKEGFADGKTQGEAGRKAVLDAKTAQNLQKLQDALDKAAEDGQDIVDGKTAGYQTGVTGAEDPDLTGKSDAYKAGFTDGKTQGEAGRKAVLDAKAAQNLQTLKNAINEAAEKAAGRKSGYQTGATGAADPDLTGKSDAYKDGFADGKTQGEAARNAV